MLDIRPLRPEEVSEAAHLVAQGMADNPIHTATWPDSAVRGRALLLTFEVGQRRPGKWALAGFSGDLLVAVAGVSVDGACRPAPAQAKEGRDRLAEDLGRPAAERYGQWRAGWASHDLDEAHWHFGPFTVLPDRRRQGAGTEMLEHFCRAVDDAGSVAYLEADRAENVPFYRRHGFKVVAEDEVLGVRTWYMRRDKAEGDSN